MLFGLTESCAASAAARNCFDHATGFDVSFVIMVIAAIVLYFVFKRRDWL